MKPELNPVWKALADPTRRQLLDLLRQQPRTTGDLAGHFDMSRIGVMKHLGILESAGLVLTKKEGRHRWHHLNAVPIREIYQRWVVGFQSHWAEALVALKDVAENEQGDSTMSEASSLNSFHIEQQITINAPREKVFAALTKGVDNWWAHRLNKGTLTLDCRLGGYFQENWGDGEGAIWGTVQRLERPSLLRLNGPLGMTRPASSVYEYALEEDGDKTILKLSHRVAGDIDPDSEAHYTEGWKILWKNLTAYVEEGKTLADS